MVKPRRATIENNRKMTDFFALRTPSSPAPLPSSGSVKQKAGNPNKSPEQKKTTLSRTQPSSQTQTKLGGRLVSTQHRTVKKENAPPLPRTQPPLSREVTYISSSSDTATRISISSASIQSMASSVVEVVQPVKQDRRHLQTIDVGSSSLLPSQRRRSPRLQEPREQTSQTKATHIVPRPRRRTTKKRKKPEGVQSDDGDLIDLETMEEVIYVTSKPARADLVTPEPSTQPSPERKRVRLNPTRPPGASSDIIEVIPSSQSDEREMCLPKIREKDLREITDTVREWQMSSSQPDFPPETSDGFEPGSQFDDPGMDADFDYPPALTVARERSRTPASTARTARNSSMSTPQKQLQSQTSSKLPSARRASSSAVSELLQISSGSKSPSPMLVSSASSSTKVDMPVCVLSPKAAITPGFSPIRRLFADKSPRQRSPSRITNVSDTDMGAVPLLSQNQKTDAIVEKIKAEARAKAMTMPDEDSVVLGSLDDSDSDLGSPIDLLQFARERTSVQPATKPNAQGIIDIDGLDEGNESPLTDLDDLESEIHRARSTRRQTGRFSPSSLSAGTRTRKAPSMLPTTLTGTTRQPTKRLVNPFSKLLGEKARHDRFTDIRKDLNLDLDDVLCSGPEEGSVESPSKQSSQLTRQPSDEGDLEKVVGEVGRRKLLGEGGEDVLGRIIESDRRHKGKKKATAMEFGVPLWESASEETIGTDVPLPDHPLLVTADTPLALLRQFTDERDVDSLTALLQSGMLDIKDVALLEWLLEVAISCSGSVAGAACTALGHVCESHRRTFTISMSPILNGLSKLGARQDVLKSLDLETPSCDRLPFDDAQRSDALRRLSEVIGLFASKAFLDRKDVPSIFALLLAIGMDQTSPSSLKTSVKSSLNALANKYCAEFSDDRGYMERNICALVLRLTSDLSPANKAYLLSFIDGDNRVERRIAQWIAFAMLTGDYGVRLANEHVAGPPPLSDLIALLNPRLDSECRSDVFNISRNSEHFDSFDYAALAFHVEVLGRVLMNIPEYVAIEKRERARSSSSEVVLSKSTNEVSKLQTVKELLDRLGNNIADTRAAHLDRSQAKAVILQLAVRIHYQRSAAIVTEKPRIESFFRRKAT